MQRDILVDSFHPASDDDDDSDPTNNKDSDNNVDHGGSSDRWAKVVLSSSLPASSSINIGSINNSNIANNNIGSDTSGNSRRSLSVSSSSSSMAPPTTRMTATSTTTTTTTTIAAAAKTTKTETTMKTNKMMIGKRTESADDPTTMHRHRYAFGYEDDAMNDDDDDYADYAEDNASSPYFPPGGGVGGGGGGGGGALMRRLDGEPDDTSSTELLLEDASVSDAEDDGDDDRPRRSARHNGGSSPSPASPPPERFLTSAYLRRVRVGFLVINAPLVFVGLVLLSFALYVAIVPGARDLFYPTHLAALFGFSVVLCALTVLSFAGSLREKRSLLFLYITLVVSLLFCELGLFISLLVYSRNSLDWLDLFWERSTDHMHEWIQNTFHCCDWNPVSDDESLTESTSGACPPDWTVGCESEFTDVAKAFRVPMTLGLVFLLFGELLSLLLCITLVSNIPSRRKMWDMKLDFVWRKRL